MALDKKDPDLLAYKKAQKSRDAAGMKKYADRLLRANMSLVASLVKKYSKWAPAGAEMEDMMQAGCIAFLRTLEKTDPNRPFSTLCGYWVRYEVGKCMEKSTTIYRPRGSGTPFATVRKAEEVYAREGRRATPEELGVTQEEIDRWAVLPTTTSIDAVTPEGVSMHGVLPTESASAEEGMIIDEGHAELRALVATLPPEHHAAIDLIFFKDWDPQDVAASMAIPYNRVIRYQEEALRMLRGLA